MRIALSDIIKLVIFKFRSEEEGLQTPDIPSPKPDSVPLPERDPGQRPPSVPELPEVVPPDPQPVRHPTEPIETPQPGSDPIPMEPVPHPAVPPAPLS